MEVFILDSLLRRTQVVDRFESLIWTERFSEIGDFELDLKSTLEARGQFQTGTRLAINNSYRVMTVETVEDTTDTDGKEMLKVKGRSLEAILEDRVAKNTLSDTTTDPVWVIDDLPADVARTMFDHICRDGALDLKDIIPFLMPGSIFPPSTIPEPTVPIIWQQSPDALATAIKSLCDTYDLGFRLVRNFDMSQLYFDIYAGSDRTTKQNVLKPVIFAVDLNNIQNTSELTNIQKSKNVAYVFSSEGFVVVYGEKVDPTVQGFDRRVLVVNTYLTADVVDVNGALIQIGQEALQQSRAQSLFDGELNQYSEYVYGVDYQLGDLVEMRNKDGIITYKRVTEQIFVSDAQGERSYPTLTMDMYVGTDTWVEWTNKTTAWADYDYFGTVYASATAPNVDLIDLPAGVALNKNGMVSVIWNGGTNTTDERALLDPDGITRNAGVWIRYHVVGGAAVWDDLIPQFTFTDAWDGILRMYFVDWDGTARRQTITVTDSNGAQVQAIANSFHDGIWLDFPVHVNAGGTLSVVVHCDIPTGNAVMAGMFLDDSDEGSTWADM